MKQKWIFFLLVLILCFSGCSSPTTTTEEFFAMNTVMTITIYENNQNLISKAKQTVVNLESLLSVTNPNSEIYKANQGNGSITHLSEETISLLQSAVSLSKETKGLFNITVYPAVKAWGFTQNKNRVPSEQEIKECLSLIDMNYIQIKGNAITLPKGVMIDLGGIAKGYAADKIAKELEQSHCTGAVLSFGGNVKTVGKKPNGELFQIAIQDPNNNANAIGTLSVSGNTAVVTSGDYQRYFESNGKRYHHIIDPRTAAPAQSDLTSVTVICSSATRADAYATALYIMGLEEGLKFVEEQPDIEALFITKTNEVYKSSGLSSIFQPDNQSYIFH